MVILRQQGKHTGGKPPWGYKVVGPRSNPQKGVKGNRRLAPDWEERALMLEIVRLRDLERIPCWETIAARMRQMQRDARRAGIDNPPPFSAGSGLGKAASGHTRPSGPCWSRRKVRAGSPIRRSRTWRTSAWPRGEAGKETRIPSRERGRLGRGPPREEEEPLREALAVAHQLKTLVLYHLPDDYSNAVLPNRPAESRGQDGRFLSEG